ARSLQRRLFRAHLEEADCNYSDLLLHTDVRWLSRGRFLQRFQELCPEIKEFLLVIKHAEYKQLNDDQWLLDLAFLTDLTNMLNELNLELQGKDKTVVNMMSSVNAFKRKMQHLSSKLHDLGNFQNLASELETQRKACAQLDSVRYTEQIENCLSDFDKRFQDFALLEPIATFMCYPFREDIEVDSLASKIAMFHLNSSAVEEEKYPNMRKCATSLTAGKIIKSKYCSTMSDDHLEACLRLATSSYCLDYATLADSIQCKSSE
ncbi:hypothetical protein LDENG_00297180, partial [Lucifuga dentata]